MSALGPITYGKDFNFFQKVEVSSPTFNNNCDLIITFATNSISLFNEGTGVIEASFNGNTVHAELNPNTGTSNVTINASEGISKIWFRLQSGTSSFVRVQSNADIHPEVSVTFSSPAALTANQGAPTTLSSAWPVEITDGSSVLGTPTNPIRNDPTGTTVQPVSGSVTVSGSVEITDGSNILGTSAHPVRIDPTGITTQPVSGTITANQGTATTLAGAWPIEMTDGSNVLGTSTHPVRTDPTGTTVQPVSGTVDISTSLSSNAGDSFGRLRVSETFSLFDTVHQYDSSPLYWDKISIGSGSVSSITNQSAVQLSVGTTSGDSIVFQTHNYLRYQPGKGQLIYLSGLLGAKTTNLVRRAGYYDGYNGVFFEVTGTDIAIVRRTFTSGSVVDNRTTQSSWNLDTLDGSANSGNPSGLLLDITKTQLMVIDLQWLSVGNIRYGFQINGEVIYVNISKHANILTVPYMTTANLPVRYELTNTGTTSGTNTLLSICSTVMSEGGQQTFGYSFGANTGTTVIGISTSNVPILSIRPSLTFNSIINRGLIRLTDINVISDQILLMQIILNGTLTGASFSSVDATNSITEKDTSASAISGGIILYSSYVGAAAKIEISSLFSVNLSKKLLSLNAAGTVGDIITITLSKCNTNATAVVASFDWLEFR